MSDEIRRLHKEVAGLRQAVNRLVMIGRVKEVKGDRVKLELQTGDEDEVLSPSVRLGGQASGHKGGGASVYTRPGEGETMLLVSPGGKVGKTSRAFPAGPVDDNPAPGTAEQDGHVLVAGDGKVIVKNGAVEIISGGASIKFAGGRIVMTGPVEINGETLKHNDRNVGATHVHSGVMPGAAKTQQPDP